MPDKSKSKNAPDLIAYTVTTGADEKNYFHKLGVAWKNSAGGYGIRLFATPVDGEIVLLPPKEKTDALSPE